MLAGNKPPLIGNIRKKTPYDTITGLKRLCSITVPESFRWYLHGDQKLRMLLCTYNKSSRQLPCIAQQDPLHAMSPHNADL